MVWKAEVKIGCETVRTNRHALDFGVGIGYGKVIEEEHAVERLGEELDLCLSINQLGHY